MHIYASVSGHSREGHRLRTRHTPTRMLGKGHDQLTADNVPNVQFPGLAPGEHYLA